MFRENVTLHLFATAIITCFCKTISTPNLEWCQGSRTINVYGGLRVLGVWVGVVVLDTGHEVERRVTHCSSVSENETRLVKTCFEDCTKVDNLERIWNDNMKELFVFLCYNYGYFFQISISQKIFML